MRMRPRSWLHSASCGDGREATGIMGTGPISAGGGRNRAVLNRRNFLTGVTAAAALPFLGACSGSPGAGSSTLRMAWWGAQDRHKKTLALIKLFEQKNAGVKINPEYGGLEGFQDKISTQMAGGNAPDILQLPDALQFVASGQLMDLGSYSPKTIDLTSANKNVLETSKINGKNYGIPWGLAAGVMFYDTEVLKKAEVDAPQYGWNWDDFAEAAKAISKATPDGVYGAADIWAPAGTQSFAPFSMFLRQHGKQPYTADGGLGFDKDDLTEWLTFWDELRKAGAVTPAKITALETGYETSPLVTGKAAIYPINSSIATSLQALVKHPLGITTLPTGIGSTELKGPDFGSYVNASLMIYGNAHSKSPEVVAKFVNFVINDPGAANTQLMARGVPLSSKISKLISSKVTPIERSMTETISYIEKHGKQPVVTAPAKSSQMGDLSDRTHQNVAFGRATISEAVNQFFTDAERMLA